jgi:hypothetical protein
MLCTIDSMCNWDGSSGSEGKRQRRDATLRIGGSAYATKKFDRIGMLRAHQGIIVVSSVPCQPCQPNEP